MGEIAVSFFFRPSRKKECIKLNACEGASHILVCELSNKNDKVRLN